MSITKDDKEFWCEGCGDDSDWMPVEDGVFCALCEEYTCAEHVRPRHHHCEELREPDELGRKVA